jgi:hypothetical protein
MADVYHLSALCGFRLGTHQDFMTWWSENRTRWKSPQVMNMTEQLSLVTRQLDSPPLVDRVEAVIKTHGRDPFASSLVIQFMEDPFQEPFELIKATLAKLEEAAKL